ncbi:MAG TPA: C39 family peptidase [Methanospirillum sp.]|uniref:C39 family peptidase n=1 Tax=Methanospirillum sp. TaxID=45200 RepID=UPI002CCBF7B3|nr:C39 family peptidase [Methanospirillum sp.]HWQ63834.1 C39 family peptidase [Methanospirillum sp.]
MIISQVNNGKYMLKTRTLFFLILLCAGVGTVQAYSLNISDLMGGAAAYKGLGDHPDSEWYTPFSINASSDENLTLIKVPSVQQSTEITCGSAAALDNLLYYGSTGDEMSMAEEMGTVPVYGANVVQMAKLFTDRGWTVHSSTTDGDGDLALLQNNLKAGVPTLVAWADWGGHWMVVTGYDTMGTDTVVDDVIIFADPYDVTDHNQDGYYRFPAARFYSLWFVPHWYPDKDSVRPWLTATPPAPISKSHG